TISRMTGERFGNMPLPIEMSSKAAEGELMVSKTTGHVYVRNGSKNVSKTVELEEFLKAFRVGCMNWIRNSGDFYEELARADWIYVDQHLEGDQNYTFETGADTGRKYIKLTTSNQDGWKFLFNKTGSYYKIKFLANNKICVSLKCKSSINTRISVMLCDCSQAKWCTNVQTKDITTDWNKYEFILTSNGNIMDTDIGLYISFPTNSMNFYLEYCQMEPGDRSSAWRPSWLDFLQRLDYLDDGLREWVKEQIQNAITECKEYTDSEIQKLDIKLQGIISNAINTCKNYTNEEIKKVNNRINTEVDELIKRDMIQRVHLNLGNQDYTKYLTDLDGNKIDQSALYYSNANKGIIVKGRVSLRLDLPIPITETSKYYISFTCIRLKGTSQMHVGVDSLDDSLNRLQTDNANSYNYGIMCNETFNEGAYISKNAIYSGFNTPAGDETTKFDPWASYFRLVFLLNYNCADPEAHVVIKDIEIFEIPKCLWNAIDPGPRNRDGLMSVADKTKLDGIEERANRYVHPTGDGNLHVPATGSDSNGKVLTAGSTPGTLRWMTPSTNAETVDGFDSNRLLREVQAPSHRDCNQFKIVNAFTYMDSGEGDILNTPEGTLKRGTSRVIMIINRYSSYISNTGIRIQQEFINLYSDNKTTRYIRNGRNDGNENMIWGVWEKVYTTGDRPTPAEVGAVNKQGDDMYNNLNFTGDNTGVYFYNGSAIYKKIGTGLIIKCETSNSGVQITDNAENSILSAKPDIVESKPNFKSKNIDLGRFSIKHNADTQALDFIFE
ncbi:hypothetical protein V6O07_00875, partial [Arthrospira platensis SPKY2]